MRKMQRRLSLLCLLLIAGGLYRPDLVPLTQVRPYFEQGRSWIDGLAIQDKPDGLVKGLNDEILPKIKEFKIPSDISGLPEEVVVEDFVASMTGELAKLPAKEFQRIQQSFCQDLLSAAMATVSGVQQ